MSCLRKWNCQPCPFTPSTPLLRPLPPELAVRCGSSTILFIHIKMHTYTHLRGGGANAAKGSFDMLNIHVYTNIRGKKLEENLGYGVLNI